MQQVSLTLPENHLNTLPGRRLDALCSPASAMAQFGRETEDARPNASRPVAMNPMSQTTPCPSVEFVTPALNTFRIRVARSNDRSSIVDVINAVAGERKHLTTSCYRPIPPWEDLLDDGMSFSAGYLLLAVEVNEMVVGFGRLFYDWYYAPGRHTGNLGLALLAPYRAQGIGSLLLERLVRWAPLLGFCSLSAVILPGNVASLCLFGKQGFRFVKTVSVDVEYQSNEAPALLFVRPLDTLEASA